MPLIQIEQDSPEVIERVRAQIEEMAKRLRTHPELVLIAEEAVYGYITALLHHHLLSIERVEQLQGEKRAAAKAALAG